MPRYRKLHTKTPGFVYVLRRNDGWYKIGHTRNLPQRFRAWRWQAKVNHYELSPVFLIATAIPRLLEKSIQGFFRSKQDRERHNGFGPYREWFKLIDEDLDLIVVVSSRFGELQRLRGIWPDAE